MNRRLSLSLPIVVVLAALCAVFVFPALPAEACSINAAGSCGGTDCPEGETCTKVSDVECDCVDDRLLSLAADDNACLKAAAAVASLARQGGTRPRLVSARNCLGDCLAECRDDHLDCIDFCREFEPGDPQCIDDCNRERDACDDFCFDLCSDGASPAPQPLAVASDELELPAAAASEGRSSGGGVIAVRVFFKVQGLGSFTAGSFDTADGDTNAWVKPGLPLRLSASPGPGHRFSHWLLNGQFASAEPRHTARASRGLTITAVFQRSSQ